MNETLVKALVKLKLEMVEECLDRLSDEEAEEIRKLGRTFHDAFTEYREAPSRKKEETEKKEIHSIPVE